VPSPFAFARVVYCWGTHGDPMRLKLSDPFVIACVARLDLVRWKACAAIARTERAIADTDRVLRAARAALADRPIRCPDPPARRSFADEWAAIMRSYPTRPN
jgi:hypothetical protein